MFSADFVKWLFVAGLYDVTAQGAIRTGTILTKKEFLAQAVLIQLGPEDIADLAVAGKRFQFALMKIQPPAAQVQRLAGVRR